MRVQRFNLIPDKLEYKIKSLENIKNKIIDFFCLDSSIEINYSIINDYEMSISIKKSVKKEIPVLYQFNEKYIKNDKWKNKLFQTYKHKNDEIKPMLKECKDNWLKLNPNLIYTYYTDEDCIKFLSNFYDNSFVEVFNNIKQGVLKCDFFRICYLYIVGGFYCDIDMVPLVPFKDFIDDKITFCSVVDSSRTACFNAFIYSSPRNPILLDSILLFLRYNHKEIVWKIGAFGSCTDLLLSIKKQIVNTDPQRKVPLLMSGLFNDGKVKILEEVLMDSDVYSWQVCSNGKPLIKSRMCKEKYDYINHCFVVENNK
jgi:mannosyltransferase OCH1-like enzyme